MPRGLSTGRTIMVMDAQTAPPVVLVATQDEYLVQALAQVLDGQVLRASTTDCVEDLLHEVRDTAPASLLLDGRSLEETTLQACRLLRSSPTTVDLPLIVLTSLENVGARIQSLQCGADDSIAMPANVDELAARIRALRRRRPPEEPILRAGSIEVDLAGWSVSVDGKQVRLTRREFLLLRVLIESKGRVLSREELLSKVWPPGIERPTRTVDVHVGRLRRKLGTAGRYIITVRSVGFRFDLVADWVALPPQAAS